MEEGVSPPRAPMMFMTMHPSPHGCARRGRSGRKTSNRTLCSPPGTKPCGQRQSHQSNNTFSTSVYQPGVPSPASSMVWGHTHAQRRGMHSPGPIPAKQQSLTHVPSKTPGKAPFSPMTRRQPLVPRANKVLEEGRERVRKAL